MGSGGMVVMDENNCMVEIARFFLSFTQSESCGKCAPCRGGTRAALTCFIRDTRNLIDWVRRAEEDPWQATNIGAATFVGGEAMLSGSGRWCDWRAAYRYTEADAATGGLDSKYALHVARHDVRLTLGLPETRGFAASLDARYRDVPTLDRTWLLAGRVAQRIGRAVLYARGRNLLDTDYEEIPGVPTARAPI